LIKWAVGTVHGKELEYAVAVEDLADSISWKILGYAKTPWWELLQYCVYIHIGLTMLVCFIKSDFINLTVVLMLLWMKYFAEDVKRVELRLVAVAIIISWIFDLIWMFFHLGAWFSKFNPEHSDVEVSIRRFCAIITLISFIFRFVLFVVTWKISVEFDWLFRPHPLLDEKMSWFASPPNNKQNRVYIDD